MLHTAVFLASAGYVLCRPLCLDFTAVRVEINSLPLLIRTNAPTAHFTDTFVQTRSLGNRFYVGLS